MTWTHGRCELADGRVLRTRHVGDGRGTSEHYSWIDITGRGLAMEECILPPHPTEREAQVAAEKAAGVHVEAVSPVLRGASKRTAAILRVASPERDAGFVDPDPFDPPQTPLAASVAKDAPLPCEPNSVALDLLIERDTLRAEVVTVCQQRNREASEAQRARDEAFSLRTENDALRERVRALEGERDEARGVAYRVAMAAKSHPELRDPWFADDPFGDIALALSYATQPAATPDGEEA